MSSRGRLQKSQMVKVVPVGVPALINAINSSNTCNKGQADHDSVK